ncbi:MAG: DUF4388 domain-containing protein [Acidobacteria bacterium]|nr:DUF4388 domain-containing protein [Acidobacteriota bacterium]
MALSGQLSDLSLAELIEFFCNQRKSGRLKVSYPRAPGFFYFQKGALVDAKIGALSGVEAVYYALTLENASFKFSASFEPTRRTIHQPWAQVALEGLRRMDEGIAPSEAFPEGYDAAAYMEDAEGAKEIKSAEEDESENVLPMPKRVRAQAQSEQAPLSLTVENASGGGRRVMVYGAIAAAVIISVAAVGFPAGWYGKKKAAAPPPAAAVNAEQQVTNDASSNPSDQPASTTADPSSTEQVAGAVNDSAALAARREREARERERWKNAQEKAADAAAAPGANPSTPAAPAADAAKKPEPAKPKTMTVQVTYDEAGRVTGASGGDANALRIARQKRFPAGKAGSATVTIPVN